MMTHILRFAAVYLLAAVSCHAARAADDDPREALRAALPAGAAAFDGSQYVAVQELAKQLEQWAADRAVMAEGTTDQVLLRQAGELVQVKADIDTMLEQMLELRGQFAALPAGQARRESIRDYLRVVGILVDLTGQLHYLLYDGLYDVAVRVASRSDTRDALIAMLLRHGSEVGAAVMGEALLDPPADTANGAQPASRQTKRRLLDLIGATRHLESLPTVVEFVMDPSVPGELVVHAAATIRQVGLPQDERPGQDATLPKPPVTAAQLSERLRAIDAARLDAGTANRHAELLEWLDRRRAGGIVGVGYRLGPIDVRAGDWLVMRNPSPYNLFTDLGPGLFTHVGVITTQQGSDGIRRMVVVDLPERGKKMRATNLDAFVDRTLHYVVLRDNDRHSAARIAARARESIGLSTRFDLGFRTERVERFRGLPLEGQTIHTYCAGLLVLCVQETGVGRDEYFPIPENPAGGRTVENLAKLGVSVGENLVSPTGVLFSNRLSLVGRRSPVYEPRREIEQAIYDHFANGLRDRELKLAPGVLHALLIKLGQASKNNQRLADLLADTGGIGRDIDVASAAQASAVVYWLDQIAMGESGQFLESRQAFFTGPDEPLDEPGVADGEAIAAARVYLERHAPLYQSWIDGRLSPRQLRIELVDYYIERGRQAIDERFFGGEVGPQTVNGVP